MLRWDMKKRGRSLERTISEVADLVFLQTARKGIKYRKRNALNIGGKHQNVVESLQTEYLTIGIAYTEKRGKIMEL